MKQGKLLIHISILLFTILLSTKVHGNENIEINGNDNVTGNGNITGNRNIYFVCKNGATCNNNKIFNSPEAVPSENQTNPVTEEIKSTYRINSGGLSPTQIAPRPISISGGLSPKQIAPRPISRD